MIHHFVYVYIHNEAEGYELTYSLRSLCKNFKGNFNVTIVGDKPKNITGVNHIPCERIVMYAHAKWFDQLNKILLACQSNDVPPTFIYMYDDIYFVKPLDFDYLLVPRALNKLENYDYVNCPASNRWKGVQQKTLKFLRDNNLSTYNYETHSPRVYNSEKMIKLARLFKLRVNALSLATTYFNYYLKEHRFLYAPGEYYRIRVNKKFASPDAVKEFVGDYKILNHRHKTMNHALRGYLKSLFPDKCRFEI